MRPDDLCHFNKVRKEDMINVFLETRKSVTKLKPMVDRFAAKNGCITRLEDTLRTAATMLFYSHLAAASYLYKGDGLDCPVPWDDEAKLPTPPTLMADAGCYVKIFRPKDMDVRSLLLSFSGWMVFSSGTFSGCACRTRFRLLAGKNSLRNVPVEIKVNHILQGQQKIYILKQLVGVGSDDLDHLVHHYDISDPSQVEDNLIIISRQAISLETDGENIITKPWTAKEKEDAPPNKKFQIGTAGQLDADVFCRRIQNAKERFMKDFAKIKLAV